ncbi:hypothetical protein [Vibrio sp. 99-70-13A1]|uniref:hypothetical protein n=1 Tax=Vibrio sp. 99-70-13A1 TaxID=2607601 RepID=UPI001493AC9E|nr:hypothetical protein [Vibrio sp. 99-70-13A1]NOH96685.1 hypothetical protein [Vibrio sp. 99-70-13A1]
MPKLLNKIWIHAFMLFAMLLANSSFAASNSTENMLVPEVSFESTSTIDSPHFFDGQQQVTSLASTESLHLDCPDSHSETEITQAEHTNCSSVCQLKMPPFKASNAINYQPQSLALIEREPKLKPVLNSQTLLRPPIS